MKVYIAFIIFILSINAAAGNPGADSLKSLLNYASGKERITLLIKLIEKIEGEDPNSAREYGKEAINLIKKYPDRNLVTQVYNRMGWIYTYLDNSDSAKYFAELTGRTASTGGYAKGEVMRLFLIARISRNEGKHENALQYVDSAYIKNESLGDNYYKARLLNEKGSVLRRLSQYDEAFELHKQALAIINTLNDDKELRTTLTYLGIISDIRARYDDALRYHLEALEIAKRISDERSAAASLHNIGVLYGKIEKYEEALEYYKRALQSWKKLNSVNNLASTLNNIGSIYENKHNYKEAFNYYNQALSIWEKSGRQSSIIIGLQNVGTISTELGNYKQASDYLTRALAIGRELGDKHGQAGALNSLSLVFNKLGRSNDAIEAASEAVKIAEGIGSWTTIRQAHENLSYIYENSGQYEEALAEYKKFMGANDTIFNSERQRAIAEMQEKYKSSEQKKQIEILQKDSKIQSLHTTYLLIGIVLLLIVILLIYSRYRLKHRAHQAFEKLHEREIETFNLRTEAAEAKAAMIQIEVDQKRKELNAARELQLSMLPSVIPAHPNLSVAAKMITATEVGGDYYDFHKAEDNSFTIVIGDATGHGAQAGVMVTAAKSLFTLLAREENILDILCHATQAVKKMRFSNLFMAFAVMRIKGNELEYAGAGMPPAFILRSDNGIVEELSLKGLPLGIASGNEYTKFNTKINKGDTVLLMSDGFPELFNQNKESLGYEKVPLLLRDTGDKSPGQIISHITDKASQWLNGNIQHDDMTFIVFKLT